VLHEAKTMMFWMRRWISSKLEIMVTVSQECSGRSVVSRHLFLGCLLEHSSSVRSCF